MLPRAGRVKVNQEGHPEHQQPHPLGGAGDQVAAGVSAHGFGREQGGRGEHGEDEEPLEADPAARAPVDREQRAFRRGSSTHACHRSSDDRPCEDTTAAIDASRGIVDKLARAEEAG